jgi:hypothetical protein
VTVCGDIHGQFVSVLFAQGALVDGACGTSVKRTSDWGDDTSLQRSTSCTTELPPTHCRCF